VSTCFLVLSSIAHQAEAVSAYARKHELSCQTCHIAYPKLTAYGTAFRNLGYRLPGGAAEQGKNPDIPLGATAYKKVWPKAVWPGAIPSQLPLALAVDFLVQDSQSVANDGDITKTEAQFLMPSGVALIAGGTAGDNISYFGEIAFTQELEGNTVQSEVEVEHFDLRFIRLIADSMAFNLKVGAFQPELVETFDHARRLTVGNYNSMFNVDSFNGTVEGGHHGGTTLALPAIARGFEGYGIVKGRFNWAAGLVSGVGPDGVFDGNSSKDTYGRVGYKWGGLALDGSNADSFVGDRKNWRERSFRLNAFVYRGDSSDIFNTLADEHADEPADDHVDARFVITQFSEDEEDGEHEEELEADFYENEDSTRWGFDFNWFFDDLNVFGAWVAASDDINLWTDATRSRVLIPDGSGSYDYEAWFVEADLVLGYPWLHGALRYESVEFDSTPEGLSRPDWERATMSLTGLIRANVKCVAEYSWDLNRSRDHEAWLGLGVVF
jgi:hypothetical protein